jgi:hypothetical protein
MKVRTALILFCLGAAATSSAMASPWVSLGRINALTAMPNVDQCNHRIINRYWNPAAISIPVSSSKYSDTNIQFHVSPDLSALRFFTSNSPSLSKFKTALDFYNSTTAAKSIYATVSVGSYPDVSIQVAYADANGLVQGSGWGIARSELSYYELQESCPL